MAYTYFVNSETGDIYPASNETIASSYRKYKNFVSFTCPKEASAFAASVASKKSAPAEPEAPKSTIVDPSDITPQDAVIAEMSTSRRVRALPGRKKK